MILGLFSGGSLTLGYTIGGLLIPGERRATAFGFLAGSALFGGALSPSVAGFLVRWDLRGIFYLDTALFAALVVGQLVALRSDRATAARGLGYDPADFLAETYADLHRRRCEERGMPFGDMLFREEGA